LSRPDASQALKDALAVIKRSPASPRVSCHLALLYDRAGLRRQANKQLRIAKSKYGNSLYTAFLEALLAYRKRDYRNSRKLFVQASDHPSMDGELKASFLAAAGCAAFACGDIIEALNLSERALEFDHASLVARMVKVDVFLRQGRREQAGQEILTAMHLGLTLELDNKVPLDTEHIFRLIILMEEKEQQRPTLQISHRH
jgi:tetratricopeptide (TPR) repeat protein